MFPPGCWGHQQSQPCGPAYYQQPRQYKLAKRLAALTARWTLPEPTQRKGVHWCLQVLLSGLNACPTSCKGGEAKHIPPRPDRPPSLKEKCPQSPPIPHLSLPFFSTSNVPSGLHYHHDTPCALSLLWTGWVFFLFSPPY